METPRDYLKNMMLKYFNSTPLRWAFYG